MTLGQGDPGHLSRSSSNRPTRLAKVCPTSPTLIKVAKEDQDLTFRIWAARRLGYALFERGDHGQPERRSRMRSKSWSRADSNKLRSPKAAAEGGRSIKDKPTSTTSCVSSRRCRCLLLGLFVALSTCTISRRLPRRPRRTARCACPKCPARPRSGLGSSPLPVGRC